ncbi:outer membrane protein assembly factor BamA [Amylibacter sp.]|nr:outer membrane protein assembly factor BamA [Amylibacter sp.]
MIVFFYPKRNKFLQNLHIFPYVVTLFVALSVLPFKAYSDENMINTIVIEGNKRISSDTIINISKLNEGILYESSQLNTALQRIKSSTYFEIVELSFANNILRIKVKENPTINSISFEGNNTLDDTKLSQLISLKERQTLSILKTEKNADIIAAAYADTGKISATITPKLIKLSDNRVDLVFEIVEGRITEIEKISFAGNRKFSDRRLKAVIATKQAGLFNRLIKSDTYVQDRLEYDKDLLQSFYVNKGYIDFEVETSVKLTRSKDAFLIDYLIKEGQKYSFGKIDFDIGDIKIKKTDLFSLSKIKEKSSFDQRKITKLINEIDLFLSKNGYNFIIANPIVVRNDIDLSMDLVVSLQQTQRTFVERIEVEGNSTTIDEVIRLQFDFVEGDPFNRNKILEAVDKIRGLGFFSSVETDTRVGSTPEKIIIEVKLIEKPTGSLGLGAGFNSSDGAVFTFNLNERNFLGKGQTVKLDYSSSKIEKQTSIGLEDPSFMGRNLLAGISFGQQTTTPSATPLKMEKLYFAPKIGFPLSRDSNISIIYRYDQDEVKLSSANVITSPLIVSDVGNLNKSGLTFSYNLDKTNSIVSPTAGYNFRLTQEFNGLGGNISYTKSAIDFKTYKNFFRDDIILSSDFSSGIIIGSDANITNRFFLGGDGLKGFRNQGVGPVDNTYYGADANGDPLGGKMFTSISLEASFPIGVPEEYGIFGGLFVDAGSVWGLDNTDSGRIDDAANLRAALGASIFWDTLIGPLRFNFSRPIKKEAYDVIENFRFTVDTRF